MDDRLLKLAFRIVLLLAIPFMVALFTYKQVKSAFFHALDENNKTEQLFVIESGANFKEICKKLEAAGLIKNAWILEFIARRSDADTQISAGEYMLSPALTPQEMLARLVSGDVLKRMVTVTEGMSIWEIGKIVEAEGLVTAESFNKALTDPSLLAIAGILAPSFEGYLFPETYAFSKPTTAKSIIFKMVEEGEKHWPQEFNDQAFTLNLSRHDSLTLASIIEKEAGNREEMTIISSVFHNRLKQGMKLQSDPTVIYGIPNFDGNLTKTDLITQTPYNTYTNFGLPPGPIANPGDAAIRAALYPDETTYLFFVSNGKRGHVFSTTLKEHNAAVKQFQLGAGAEEKNDLVVPLN